MDLKNHLMKSTTVSINRDLNETWIIFTDGAFEPTNTQPASIGGILLNPSGKVVSYFGCYISGSLLNVFLEESRHPIYELEIFPVVVAIRAWSKFIMGKLVFHYLDNDAARSAFIRASASTSLGTTLVTDYVNFEYKCRFSSWFARVASHSNPADQPSRLDFLRSGYVMQKGLNLSCQSTCRSGESTGALTLKHESLSRSSNMDRQHEPIRHHSFEAGITASISKLPRQCKPGR